MADARIRAVITAEDRASQVIQGVGTSVGTIAKGAALAQLAVAGLNKAFEAFKEASKFAINAASSFEQSRISFEVMLGSAEKARKLLADISDFAIKTPFELPELVEGSKRLLAYSIDAKKILPTLSALGNIAAGVGRDKLPQLILAFGQVKTATKLTGMELRQFTEAGVPLLGELSKIMGKTAAQIKADMEGGVAPSFEQVEEAIFNMSQKGGKFFNLLGRQAQTFGGVMSNIKDQFVRVALDIMGVTVGGDIEEGSFFARAKKAAEGFLNLLNNSRDEIATFFNSLSVVAIGFGTALSGAFKFILNAWTTMANYISTNTTIKNLFTSIRFLVDTLVGSVRDMLLPEIRNLMKQLSPHLANAFKFVGVIAVGFLAGVIVSLSLIAQALAQVLKFVNRVIAAFERLKNFGRDFIGNIVSKIPGIGKLDIDFSAGGILKRQHGGSVLKGNPYMVGEAGPEMFIPKQSGKIIPNHELGGATINLNVNIGMFAGTAMERRKIAQTLLDDMKDIASSKGMTLGKLVA